MSKDYLGSIIIFILIVIMSLITFLLYYCFIIEGNKCDNKENCEPDYKPIQFCYLLFFLNPLTSIFIFLFAELKLIKIVCYISQGLNFVIYSLLIVLCEKGIFAKIIHYIEQKLYCKNDKNIQLLQEKSSKININNNIIIKYSSKYSGENNYFPNSKNSFNDEKNLNINIINNGKTIPSTSLINNYVQKEIDKVNDSTIQLTTRISALKKTFYKCCGCKRVKAINNLYLGLEPNEKFGLLGFNGSGKTTTFKAITKEILIDSGSINLFNYDLKYQFEQIKKMIGYCPQNNPLFDFMTVKEIINFYLELKSCKESVESISQKYGLDNYLNTYIKNLSKGNKRKLIFAIAMMNKPSLLLLDEPSTGVDPLSRRIMWRNIIELSNSGHKYNMILTTHSMEEAEILCDTVSWLKVGNFIIKGSPEKLKIEISEGYKLYLKFDVPNINNTISNSNSYSINELIEEASQLIEGFDKHSNFIISNSYFEPYLRKLINIINKIKDKTERIYLEFFGIDFSFDFVISINKEKRSELFSSILNMKNTDKTISEISIKLPSLENVLTSLN